jgi:hypothetical protein
MALLSPVSFMASKEHTLLSRPMHGYSLGTNFFLCCQINLQHMYSVLETGNLNKLKKYTPYFLGAKLSREFKMKMT